MTVSDVLSFDPLPFFELVYSQLGLSEYSTDMPEFFKKSDICPIISKCLSEHGNMKSRWTAYYEATRATRICIQWATRIERDRRQVPRICECLPYKKCLAFCRKADVVLSSANRRMQESRRKNSWEPATELLESGIHIPTKHCSLNENTTCIL